MSSLLRIKTLAVSLPAVALLGSSAGSLANPWSYGLMADTRRRANPSKIKTLLLAAVVAASSVTSAAAATLGVDFSAPVDVFTKAGVGNNINIIGWQFKVNNNFSIDALGYFDLSGNSLTGSHDVALYSAQTGNLLASTSVTSTDVLLGQAPFRFRHIGTLTLEAGLSYILAATVGNDPYTADVGGTAFSGLSWNPNLTFGGDVFDSSNQSLPTVWTSLESADVTGGFGPNLLQVPIPGTVYLLGSGLAGLSAIRRKFRR